MKRVLVTGATGFVGRFTLDLLAARGYEVHACGLPAELASPPATAAAVRWHPLDLLAPGEAQRLVASIRPSHLLHLAWYAVPGRFWNAPENLDFVRGSLDLLRAFREAGGTRLTAVGSCAEYDWSHGTCVEATTPLRPGTLYGTAKDCLRRLIESWAGTTELSWGWGRLFFLYGPHEHPARLVPSAVCSMLAGQPARLSHGHQKRDFMYVADAAAALVALLDSTVQGPVNIATGTATSIRELVGQVAAILGTPELPAFGEIPVPENDPPLLVADTGRLGVEVGFRPTHDLHDGLNASIAWWRQHPSLTKGPKK